MNYLAIDLGGTKTLIAIFQSRDTLICIHQEKYISSNWSSLEVMIRDFLEKLPKEVDLPSTACIAVAGPVHKGRSRITNLGWELDEERIKKVANLRNIEIINDFSVLIYGLSFLKKEQKSILQNPFHEMPSQGVVAIIGAGTGLGIARGIITANDIVAVPSEGGHREFAPRTKQEWNLTEWVKNDLEIDRLSIERIVSGTGLGHIANWRLNQADTESHPLKELAYQWRNSPSQKPDLPALASKLAKEGDPFMNEALQIWLSAYGSAAGDLALQELSHAGLWIGGGTARKHIEGLRSKTFLDSLRNKGRFKPFLEKIPVIALIDEGAGLFSAACRARMLA